jgi:hypothetical protein
MMPKTSNINSISIRGQFCFCQTKKAARESLVIVKVTVLPVSRANGKLQSFIAGDDWMNDTLETCIAMVEVDAEGSD